MKRVFKSVLRGDTLLWELSASLHLRPTLYLIISKIKPLTQRNLLNSIAAYIYRGYYTVARRYEFYVWGARTISHEWVKRTSEKLFLLREHKIHIFEPMCSVLFNIIMEKPIQQKQKAGIVTSLNDTTLTKVTYGKYATQVPDEVAYGIYGWFSSQ